MPVNDLLKFPIGSYLMVRLDYVLICGDELEAKILRLIEHYMDTERKRLYQEYVNKNNVLADEDVEVTKDVWVTISHRLFMRDLYQLVKSENTLKKAIKSLIKKQFIRMKPAPTDVREACQYQINTEAVQAEFDLIEQLGKRGYQKMMVSKNDTIKNSPYQELTPSQYQKMTPSDDLTVSKNDPLYRIGNYDRNSNKDSCASPIVDAEPSVFSDDDEPTVKAPALPKTPITTTPAQDIPPVVEAAVPEQVALGNDAKLSTNPQGDKHDTRSHRIMPGGNRPSSGDHHETLPQQQALVAPATSTPRARQAKKAVDTKLEPTPDELALQERCSKWYDRVTDWCGGPMTKGGQVINEHKSIKLACQKYTDSQLEAIFKYVTTRDWKYSKIDNKYTVRCYVLWDESGRVAQILKEERQGKGKASPAVAAGYTDYTNAAPINYRPLRMPGDRKRVLV